jgi:hypothetical protein
MAEMRGVFFLVGFLALSSLCFAVDYYTEYSFAEADKIDSAEIHGGNGWRYNFVLHWTKADIQNRIDNDRQIKDSGVSFAFRRKASEFMGRILGAVADRRIFIIDTFVESGPYGWLFIKINENEYVVFYTGQ